MLVVIEGEREGGGDVKGTGQGAGTGTGGGAEAGAGAGARAGARARAGAGAEAGAEAGAGAGAGGEFAPVSSKLFLTPAASANFCCAFMALSCRIFPAPSLSQRANHLAHAHQTTSILTLVARTLLSFHPSSILLLTPDSSPLALTFLTVLLLSSLLPSFATPFPTSHSLTHSFVLLSYPSLNLILSPLASSHFPFFSPLSSPSSRFVPCSSDSCLLSYPILSYPILSYPILSSSSPLLLSSCYRPAVSSAIAVEKCPSSPH
eukprot:767886-Hanusia_phi.AAC.2